MDLLNKSAIGSLVVQFITGLIESSGLGFNVKPQDEIVKDLLFLEITVQFVEFMFYTYLVYKILTKTIETRITSQRYIDWVITTPFMLVGFAIFFKYLKEPDRKIRLIESAYEEKETLAYIVGANFLMLLFGYLAEVGILNTPLAVTLGFIPFAVIFKQLYSNYVSDGNVSRPIFYFVFLIWSLYGVAAVLPFAIKNTLYNILDLFSKNAYGLFLYFYVRHIQSSAA